MRHFSKGWKLDCLLKEDGCSLQGSLSPARSPGSAPSQGLSLPLLILGFL